MKKLSQAALSKTDLSKADPKIFKIIRAEKRRQQNQIELIASENIVSQAVLTAQGSVLTNKYAEGYPGKRYYGGCRFVDEVETEAMERAQKLFDCGYVNVQPHSGAQANQAVFLALLNPGDCIMGMSLNAGGHLTHGAAPNLSGKWFKSVGYPVHPDDDMIDFAALESLALQHRPKLIIAGGSAYPRIIDFQRIRRVADQVGAYLMVDMAHFAGLVAAGYYSNPFAHAHVITTTTHKTLRGPRGGMILTNDEDLSKRINSAVFPGLQGGPLMHVIAAKAVALGEALQPSFKKYIKGVVENIQVLAKQLQNLGWRLVSGGTDTHLILLDLRSKKLTGKVAEESLERAGITCNKNSIPFDPQKPTITSGIRLGSPAVTTRGFGVKEFAQIAEWIDYVLNAARKDQEIEKAEKKVLRQVRKLCQRFPIYSDDNQE